MPKPSQPLGLKKPKHLAPKHVIKKKKRENTNEILILSSQCSEPPSAARSAAAVFSGEPPPQNLNILTQTPHCFFVFYLNPNHIFQKSKPSKISGLPENPNLKKQKTKLTPLPRNNQQNETQSMMKGTTKKIKKTIHKSNKQVHGSHNQIQKWKESKEGKGLPRCSGTKIKYSPKLFSFDPDLFFWFLMQSENTCNSCLSLFLLMYDSVVVLIMVSNFRTMHDSDFVLGFMLCGKSDVLAWWFLCLVYDSNFVVLWIFFNFFESDTWWFEGSRLFEDFFLFEFFVCPHC